MFTFSIKHYDVSRRSRAVTAKKYTKMRDASAKLLFCQFKTIAFLPLSLPLTSSLLKLPNVGSCCVRLHVA